jgi:outer membrane protein assembly factor BamB/tetratricopeptide (TPR) repeat protein
MARLLFATLLVLCLGTAAGISQPTRAAEPLTHIGLSGESSSTARRFAAVDQLVAAEQWPEAVEEYVHILQEAGDDLVPLDPKHCVQARRLCHLRLAALPRAALRLYRDRVDSQVKKWWDQAEPAHDTRLLRRIVDEAFCSRFADRALDLLGDLAFERGDLDEAVSWWRMLALPALELGDVAKPQPKPKNQPAIDLVFPDPQVDLARVRAKQILARWCRGERDGMDAELQAYRKLHAPAEGDFAGRRGNYADTLQTLAGEPDLLASPVTEPAWTTFAGAPSRQLRIAKGPRHYFFAHPPAYLDALMTPRSPKGRALTPTDLAETLAFYPVIAGGRVLVAGPFNVQAFDLSSGKLVGQYDLQEDMKQERLDLDLDAPYHRGFRCTLTVAEQRVFVRLGNLPVVQGEEKEGAKGDSVLVCLDLEPNADGKLVRRWWVRPQEARSLFEGAPVVRDGRVYIAQARIAGAQVSTAISCYSAATGARHWRQDVCETRENAPPDRPRFRHHLVTLAGPNIAYCSHSGAIVALDALTGRRSWAVRYPSRLTPTMQAVVSPRDLAPCLYSAGRLYVAPADYDRILCLDAATGRSLWESQSMEVVHLLGAEHGKLIFTTGSTSLPSVPRGIRAVDTVTGKTLRSWMQPLDDSDLPSLGRGFLAGGKVFWPTRDGLCVLGAQDGQPDPVDNYYFSQRIGQPTGNLAWGEGCLALASADELRIYVPAARHLGRARQDAAAHPGAAVARYRLALAEMDTGLAVQALADFARAEQLAGPGESWDGVPLKVLAQTRRHEVLLDLAQQARERPEKAADYLRQAAAAEFSVAHRLRALVRHATLWKSVRQPARAVEVWQSILGDDTLRRGWITVGRLPRAAGTLAAEQIAELLRADGSEIYRPFEERARALAAKADGARRVEVAEQLGTEYPNAAVTRPTLMQLAAWHERAGRDGAAARVYRLLLQSASANSEQAPALVGLARAYERQGCWEAAATTWQRLARENGEQILPGLDSQRPVREVVAHRLQQPAYRPPSAPASSGPAVPLLRTWQVPLAAGEQMLTPENSGPIQASDSLWFACGPVLTCRAADTGKTRWSRTLLTPPSWIARHADCLLAGGAQGVQSVSLADGQVVWEFPAPVFPGEPARSEALGRFQLASSRLYCLQGGRCLFALDADSGRVLWSHTAPGAFLSPSFTGGRFNPLFHAGKDWVVIQTTDGRRQVLDSRTGTKAHEGAPSSAPWSRPPLALDDRRLCLVNGLNQVVLFDPATGTDLWSRQTRFPSISMMAPQVFRQGERLFQLVDGWELEQIDLSTGAPLWSCMLGTEPLHLTRAALDETTVYFVSSTTLQARTLADGRTRWALPLPNLAGPCRVVRMSRSLLVYPADASLPANWSPVFGSRPVVFPFLGSNLLTVPFAAREGEFPVLVVDPVEGRVVQRLNFVLTWPQAAVHLLDRGAVVAVGGQAWGLKNADN